MLVTVHPASSLSNVTVAVVDNFSGVRPALPNCAESAMVKQPAWAAAISSSGFVPFPFSNRVENEYGVCAKTPLSVETVPLPPFRSPSHTAEPFRCIMPPYVRRLLTLRCHCGRLKQPMATLFIMDEARPDAGLW